jgi:dGTPase
MSPRVSAVANALRQFLFEQVYDPASGDEQADRARDIIALLYNHFRRHPERVPEGFSVRGEAPDRTALDYVSGMTDGYALQVAEEVQPGVTRGFREQGAPVALPGAGRQGNEASRVGR